MVPGLCSLRVSVCGWVGRQDDEESFKTHFNLSDNVFAKAEVEPCNTVFLWLGVRLFSVLQLLRGWRANDVCALQAKTMLEYTHDEAIALLTKNHAEAKESLVRCTVYT